MKLFKSSLTAIQKSRKYKSIMSFCNNSYALYSLVPVSELIKILDIKELDLFKKSILQTTNFNYTLFSKKTGSPMMSFDFLNDGYRFVEEGEFVLLKNSEEIKNINKVHELKFEFARKLRYPYFLINIGEPALPDRKIHTQIIKSVIGFYLARRKTRSMARELLNNDRDIINELDRWDSSSYIRDFLLIPIKIESERKYNYIKKLNKKYESKITKKGYYYNTAELIIPVINKIDKSGKNIFEILNSEISEINEKEFAVICELKANKKSILETVTVKTSIEAPVVELARELAKLSAFKKVLAKNI